MSKDTEIFDENDTYGWGRISVVAATVIALVLLGMYIFTADNVRESDREAEAEFFEVLPEEEPEEVSPEPAPEETPEEEPAPAPAPPQPEMTAAEPKAGDSSALDALLAPGGAVAAGEAGQDGTGNAFIPGSPSRANQYSYAADIARQVERHLQRNGVNQNYEFIVRLSIDERANVTILSIDDIIPVDLEGQIRQAMLSFYRVRRPPPAGQSGQIRMKVENN